MKYSSSTTYYVVGEMLNQLTEDVLHAPFAYQKSVFSSFFRPPNTSRREREDIKNQGAPVPVARALMIDMEPKVIYQTANDAKATGISVTVALFLVQLFSLSVFSSCLHH
jgi:hypothetical protein